MTAIFNPTALQSEFGFAAQTDEGYTWDAAAKSRVMYGRVAEQIAAAALGFTLLPISGNYDVNPDGRDGDGKLYEVKSVKHGGKSPLYKWRLERDIRLDVDLTYVFVMHRVKLVRSNADLWDQFSKGVDILKMPAEQVYRLCEGLQLQTIKSKSGTRNGYQRAGYCDGYYNLVLKDHLTENPTIDEVQIRDRSIPVRLH